MGGRKSLIAKTLLITPSGALSPGPLSASAIAVGASLGALGGAVVALGHMAFELPYVAALARAAARARGILEGRAGRLLLLAMAAFTAYFAAGLAVTAAKLWGGAQDGGGHQLLPGAHGLPGAFLLGVFYTGANPYFLAWWATAGFPLVEESSRIPGGLGVMYASHVWMDYAWLSFLAASGGVAASRGHRAYSLLMAALSVVLAYYALKFAVKALRKPETPS